MYGSGTGDGVLNPWITKILRILKSGSVALNLKSLSSVL